MLGLEGKEREPTDKRIEGSRQARNVAVTLAVLIISSLSVMWWFMPRPYDCKWNPTDYLNVKVETISDIEYEVYLPIPIDSPNQTWYLVEFLNVTEGNASWSIVTTSYGLALHVVGRGSVFLRAAAGTHEYSYAGLSLANRTGFGPGHLYGEYFIYVNANGSEEDMRFYVGAGTSTPDGRPRHTVVQSLYGSHRPGWQEATGHTSEEIC